MTPSLSNRFAYHRPKDMEVVSQHEQIRDACYDLAILFETLVPESRELALAITKVEEAMMWANAGIARNQ